MVGLLAIGLLGTHVLRRAQAGARDRQRGSTFRLQDQAEVHNAQVSI